MKSFAIVVISLVCTAGLALAETPAFLVADAPSTGQLARQFDCAGYSLAQPFGGAGTFSTAATSDAAAGDSGYIVAESDAAFVPLGAGIIGGVRVWGIEGVYTTAWAPCTDAGADFDVTLYTNSGGLPGTLLETVAGTLTSQVDTGVMFAGSYPIWEYTIDFTAPSTATTVWVGVQRQDNDDNCWFLWLNNTTGAYDNTAAQWNTTWGALTYDMAMCVDWVIPVELQSMTAE